MRNENVSKEKQIANNEHENYSDELDNLDDLLGDTVSLSANNSIQRDRESMKSSVVDLLISKNNDPKNKNLKNLYQNIGSRVSKLRELNDAMISKMKNRKQDLFVYEERLQEKLKYLETLREAKLQNNKEVFNEKYKELISKNAIDLRIHYNHILYDADLKKIYEENEKEVSNLRNKLNGLVSNSKDIKDRIYLSRLENKKLVVNLAEIIKKKEARAKAMDEMAKEANVYLNEKDLVNKQIIELNEKIDEQKENHLNKIFEIKQMIDNTRKIKQFQENFAVEKFANTNPNNLNKRINSNSNVSPKLDNSLNTTNKISEEQLRLDSLNLDLKKRKAIHAYMNFSKFIYWKKQQKLQIMVEEVKARTGCENIDKLSEYLAMSTKTNKLFEKDMEKLNEDKQVVEKSISEIRDKLANSKCLLDDTSSKKFEYMEKLRNDIEKENRIKDMMNRKLYNMNRVMDLLAIGLKKICSNIDYFDGNLGSYGVVRNFFFFFLFSL